MSPQELLTFLVRKWQTIIVCMVLMTIFALIVSLVQPKRYSSEQRFLVVQELSADVDPYAATRSTQYFTGLFSKVMYSQDFLDQVIESNPELRPSIFPTESKDRAKAWDKALSATVVGDTGILEVEVLYEDRLIAQQLSLGISNVLINNNAAYHSRGNAIRVQTIDAPVTSVLPVTPNIPLNLAAALLFGLMLSLLFIYLFPNQEVSVHLAANVSLNDSRDPDWSNPMAMPTTQASPSFMYESSELQHPRGARKKNGDSPIGFNS